MSADRGERLASLEGKVSNMDTVLARHLTDCQNSQREVFQRLRALERSVWMAVGGIVILGGLIGLVGSKILSLLKVVT